MARRFAEVVRSQRMAVEMSLREVASQLGFTPAYVSDIERGNRNAPSPQVARQWADIIGADPDHFEKLARMDRRHVELALNEHDMGEARNEAALALARSWEELSDEDFAKIMDVLERRNG